MGALKVYTSRLKVVSLPRDVPDLVWSCYIAAVGVGSCAPCGSHGTIGLSYLHLLENRYEIIHLSHTCLVVLVEDWLRRSVSNKLCRSRTLT